MSSEKPIIGTVFGRLTVLAKTNARSGGHAVFLCACSCGNETATTSYKLRSGHTKSCGCLALEVRRNQARKSDSARRDPIYAIWHAVRSRCDNPVSRSYPNYGGRGITLHPSWYDYATFKRDIGIRPSGTELDRIDNERGYEPGNVHWVPRTTNSRNRRSNVFLTFRGQVLCQKDASALSGIPEHVLIRRRQKGISSETLLFAPVRSTPLKVRT